jgi:hypothetical protein
MTEPSSTWTPADLARPPGWPASNSATRYWRKTSMSLDMIFAYVVGVLAALAVIGALTFALVWEWCAIRRTLAAHRRAAPDAFWRDQAAVTIPERRP